MVDHHLNKTYWSALVGIISCLIQSKEGGIQVLAGLTPSSQTVGSKTTAQFSIMILSKKNTRHKDTKLLFSLMPNFAMLSVVMLNAIMTCVVIPNLIMMTVTVLSLFMHYATMGTVIMLNAVVRLIVSYTECCYAE